MRVFLFKCNLYLLISEKIFTPEKTFRIFICIQERATNKIRAKSMTHSSAIGLFLLKLKRKLSKLDLFFKKTFQLSSIMDSFVSNYLKIKDVNLLLFVSNNLT